MNGAKSGFLLAVALLSAGGSGVGTAPPKPFEGEIHYRIEVRSRDPRVPLDLLRETYGTGFTLVFKNGDLKQTYERGKIDTVWYRRDENREYTLMRGEAYLRVSDASDPILEARSVGTRAATEEVLGFRLSKFVIRYDNDMEATYWWTPEIAIDPESLRNYRVARQDLFVEQAKSLPLIYERVSSASVKREVATKIVRRAVSDDELAIPEMPREATKWGE